MNTGELRTNTDEALFRKFTFMPEMADKVETEIHS